MSRRGPWTAGAVAVGAVAGVLALAGAAREGAGKELGSAGAVVVGGERLEVRWNDGDTFRIVVGSLKGRSARMADYNTLESYGPVHRWGAWTREELFDIAKSAAAVAAASAWECTDTGSGGGYGRLLVSCPGAAREMIGRGLAHVFVIGRPADPALLALQADAQKRKVGIWAKGVPPLLITSVHSADEPHKGGGDEEGDHTYNRVVDTRTGAASEMPHAERYDTCKEVCVGPAGAESCMVYVPFEHRYRDKPDCLRTP
ncbi:MAG TPA: nuclease [Myxococcota bacterium]|nr:nuclease [Myxococcota bacterium]